jgi:hypothetical protein
LPAFGIVHKGRCLVPVLQDGDNKHPMFAIFQQETTSKKTTGGCGIVGNFLENGYEKKQNRVEEERIRQRGDITTRKEDKKEAR